MLTNLQGSLSLMRCNFRMESTICQIEHNIFHSSNRTNRNSTCRVVNNIFHSPNRTNRLNRQTCKGSLSLMRYELSDRKFLCSPKRTNRSNRQASTWVPEYREIFLSVLMRCKWQIENSNWRIVPKILYSPNRTNRSNRQASTRE